MKWLDIQFANNSLGSWGIALAIFLVSLIVALLTSRLIKQKIIANAKNTQNQLDDVVAAVGSKPVLWILTLTGLYIATQSLTLTDAFSLRVWQVFVVAWGLAGAISIVRLINGLLEIVIERKSANQDTALQANIIKTTRSFVSVIVWIVAILFVISNLGFNVSSILAGLGLGGLAVALASKDTLSNIFGSITILLNNPFKVGEAITYQGHDGTVESIGLRDTRLRTWAGHLVVIPNSLATTSVVENISRRPSFRVLFKMELDFKTTPNQILQAKEIICQVINSDERVTGEAKVHFLEFLDSKIQLQVLYYIADPSQCLDTRHDINTNIMTQLGDAQILLAYPTMTINQPGY